MCMCMGMGIACTWPTPWSCMTVHFVISAPSSACCCIPQTCCSPRTSLSRLVNGVADSQQRGRAASSVAILSAAAGLPRCIVDLRHDASHHELPSLQVRG